MKEDIATVKSSDELNEEESKILKQQNYKWKWKKCIWSKKFFFFFIYIKCS